jgi:DNA-binding MarR family transcriptional regulator
MSTLSEEAITPQDRQGRLDEVREWAAFLSQEAPRSADAADRWTASVGQWLVDACLVADRDSLQAGLDALRDAYAQIPADNGAPELPGMVSALAEVAQAALERVEQAEWGQTVDPRTHAAHMLIEIVNEPGLSNAALAKRLDVDPSEISRTGRVLETRGLAFNNRGRRSSWQATSLGESEEKKVRCRLRTDVVSDEEVDVIEIPEHSFHARDWTRLRSQVSDLHRRKRDRVALGDSQEMRYLCRVQGADTVPTALLNAHAIVLEGDGLALTRSPQPGNVVLVAQAVPVKKTRQRSGSVTVEGNHSAQGQVSGAQATPTGARQKSSKYSDLKLLASHE